MGCILFTGYTAKGTKCPWARSVTKPVVTGLSPNMLPKVGGVWYTLTHLGTKERWQTEEWLSQLLQSAMYNGFLDLLHTMATSIHRRRQLPQSTTVDCSSNPLFTLSPSIHYIWWIPQLALYNGVLNPLYTAHLIHCMTASTVFSCVEVCPHQINLIVTWLVILVFAAWALMTYWLDCRSFQVWSYQQ